MNFSADILAGGQSRRMGRDKAWLPFDGQPLLVLMLAVDMPDMTSAVLCRLLERCAAGVGVVPRMNRRVEPLAAFYPKAAQTIAVGLLKGQLRAVRTFAEQCSHAGLVTIHDVEASDWKCFANWNDPADLPQPGL